MKVAVTARVVVARARAAAGLATEGQVAVAAVSVVPTAVAASLAAAVAAVDAVVARERAAAMEGRTQRGTVKHRHAATSEAYALPPCLGGTGTCSPRRSQS